MRIIIEATQNSPTCNWFPVFHIATLGRMFFVKTINIQILIHMNEIDTCMPTYVQVVDFEEKEG
jgi:hypothetical protein